MNRGSERWMSGRAFRLCFIALSFSIALAGVCRAEQVSLDGQMVEIPAPDGSVRLDRVNSQFDLELSSRLPANTELLIVFGSEEDLLALKQAEVPDISVMFTVQVIEPRSRISKARFAQVIENVETKAEVDSQNQPDDEGKKHSVTEDSGEKAVVTSQEPKSLGVLGKGENWVAYGVSVRLDEEGAESVYISTIKVLLHLGEKIVDLSVTYTGNDEALLEQMKEKAWKWRDQVFAANADLKVPGKGFDWKVAAGVVALIVVLVVLFRKGSPANY